MNPVCNNLITLAAAALLCFNGCSMRVGKCTYGEEPVQRGTVIVKSVKKFYSDKELYYRVTVDGFFKREFIYPENDFKNKSGSKRYKIGSAIEGTIHPGGPCPPMYNIPD